MLQLTSHQPKPHFFKEHTLTKKYQVNATEAEVWQWLNNPDTFIKTQVWPFKVEFTRVEGQHSDFEPGVFNSHHGPFMSFTGIIGEVKENYRDLKYLYGSYFLSLRWIRPHRLQFWTVPQEMGTEVTVELNTYLHSSFYSIWNWSQNIFWSGFGKKLSKGVNRK